MRWRMLLLMGGLAVLAALAVLVVRMERGRPSLMPAAEIRYIGRDARFKFTAEDAKSGLKEVRAWIQQGGRSWELLSQEFPSAGWWRGGEVRRRDFELKIEPAALGLAEGPAAVRLAARDFSLWAFKGNRAEAEFQVVVDTTPPRIDVLSTAHNVAMGGTGLAVFSLGEDVARAGVEVGDDFFPAYSEKGAGGSAYAAYFALPRDKAAAAGTIIMAADRAGNVTRRALKVRVLARKFPHDTIVLSDAFLDAKMPEFSAADPGLGTDKVQVFLKVNRDWRERDHRRLRELAAAGRPERLWSGSFTQMKNSKTMARYAESRSYEYRGRIIDQQVHLGLDLASTAGAQVTAANAGVVVLAGDLGIYGQAVVLDHGQGIFSLYAHLSGNAVKEGQRVEKGQAVGASGQTGMAGGDHLHFAVLVSGVFVNPLEWLDQHWIDDNVGNKLTPGAAPSI